MFLYLGSSGALGQFTRQMAQATRELGNIQATFAVARKGRATPSLSALTGDVLELRGCEGGSPFSVFGNYWAARCELLGRLARERPAVVIALMPHIWTSCLAAPIKRLGIRYVSIAHDACAHPGDATGIATPWLLRDAKKADMVLTLSQSVAERIIGSGHAAAERVVPLFHPDLTHGTARVRRRDPGSPLRVLFFGRILRYKGLPLLVAAVEKLRAEGLDVRLGVAGHGSLGGLAGRLDALGAEVVNRWIEDDEIGPLLARYDAIALSHVAASQSGVAATAFGHSVPVVGTPVGGLVEQVVDGCTGVLAKRATVEAFADGIRKLATDVALYNAISANLNMTAGERSMARFVGNIFSEFDRRFTHHRHDANRCVHSV